MPKRIVLVEDDDDLREATTEWLEMLGFEVEAFASAEAALSAVEARPPDALLTDLTLPGMNGIELADRARASSAGRGLLIVALTGAGEVPSAPSFDAILTKPVNMDQLAELIRRN